MLPWRGRRHHIWELMGRIAKALESFTGLWRRFEHLGMYNGADVYTDYAHHPTALRRLVEGAREFLPNRRIVLCFQPHQHARTKGLFDEFVSSMDAADVAIISEIMRCRTERERGHLERRLGEGHQAHEARSKRRSARDALQAIWPTPRSRSTRTIKPTMSSSWLGRGTLMGWPVRSLQKMTFQVVHDDKTKQFCVHR